MSVTMDEYAAIRHKFLVEGLSQRQIAKQLGISRNTVAKYCHGDTYAGLRASYCRAASMMTPDIIQFIQQCLQEDALEPNKKQHHTARRIYHRLVAEMNFTGGESTVRALVRKLRGNLMGAYVPLEFEPGSAMQIDFGTAYVYLKGNRTLVNTFCARLCYSCAPFVFCFRKQNSEAFLEGIIRAFEFFQGVPRRVIFDNAKVAVKSGSGKLAILQENYEALAAHYCFFPDFCNVRSGNEKGLVENLVGFIRRNVLVPVPRADSLDELNQQIEGYCRKYIDTHSVSGRPTPVKAMLRQDRANLLALPGRPYDVSVTDVSRISPYATIRFQTNSYSVPVKYVGQEAAFKATAEKVTILIDGKTVAVHERCYEKQQQILSLSHYLPLLKQKPRSILQARPVKQNISPRLMQLLESSEFTAKNLMEILEICTEQGEDAFWKRKNEFLARSTQPVVIQDQVVVKQVDLSPYDSLLGGNSICQNPG